MCVPCVYLCVCVSILEGERDGGRGREREGERERKRGREGEGEKESLETTFLSSIPSDKQHYSLGMCTYYAQTCV